MQDTHVIEYCKPEESKLQQNTHV